MLKRCDCGGFCRVQGELRPVGALQKNGKRKKEMVYTADICNCCNAVHARRIAKVYDTATVKVFDPIGALARQGMRCEYDRNERSFLVTWEGAFIGYTGNRLQAEQWCIEHVTELMHTNEIPSLAWQAEEARQARLAD